MPGDSRHTIWVRVVAEDTNLAEVMQRSERRLKDLRRLQDDLNAEAGRQDAAAVSSHGRVVEALAKRKKAAEATGVAELAATRSSVAALAEQKKAAEQVDAVASQRRGLVELVRRAAEAVGERGRLANKAADAEIAAERRVATEVSESRRISAEKLKGYLQRAGLVVEEFEGKLRRARSAGAVQQLGRDIDLFPEGSKVRPRELMRGQIAQVAEDYKALGLEAERVRAVQAEAARLAQEEWAEASRQLKEVEEQLARLGEQQKEANLARMKADRQRGGLYLNPAMMRAANEELLREQEYADAIALKNAAETARRRVDIDHDAQLAIIHNRKRTEEDWRTYAQEFNWLAEDRARVESARIADEEIARHREATQVRREWWEELERARLNDAKRTDDQIAAYRLATDTKTERIRRTLNEASERRRVQDAEQAETQIGEVHKRGLFLRSAADRAAANEELRRRQEINDIALRNELEADRRAGDTRLQRLVREENERRRKSADADRTTSKIRGIVDDLNPHMRHWQFIVTAVITGLIALIPVIAVVTGLLGTMLATATVALAGVGVFAAAAVGHIKQLRDALKEANEAGLPLTGQFAEVGAAWNALRRQWDAFLDATRGPVLAVFTRALETVAALLPRLIPIANAAAVAFSGVFDQIDTAMASDTFARFIEFANAQAPVVFASLARSLLSIGEGLSELVMAFGPFITWFLDGLQRMTASFADWAASLSTSERFQQFMDYVMEKGPIVWDTLSVIVEAVIHLGESLAPVGELLLFLVRVFAQFLLVLDPETIRATVFVIVALYAALKALAVLNTVITLLSNLSGLFPGLQTRIKAASDAMTGFQRAGALAAVAGAGLATALGAALGVIGLATAAMSLLSLAHEAAATKAREQRDAEQDLAEELRNNAGNVGEAFKDRKYSALERREVSLRWWEFPSEDARSTSVAEAAQAAGVNPRDLRDAAGGEAEALERAKVAWQEYIHSIEERLKVEPDKKVAQALDAELVIQKRARDNFVSLTATAEQAAAVNARYAAATGQAAGATGELALSVEVVAERLKTAYTAYDKWVDAVEALSDAQERQSDVERDSARAAEDALTAKEAAQRSEIDALNNAQQAQERLNEARRAAAERIQDLRAKLRDLAADEEGAAISLARAEENYKRTFRDPNATALDRREAALRLRQAQTAVQDQEIESQRVRKDAAKAEKEGVEGSRQVKDAVRAKLEADLAVIAATRVKTRAEQDYTEILSDNVEAVDDARVATEKAKKAVTDARREYDLAAQAAGKTAAEVERLKIAQEKLDFDLVYKLSLLDKDDALGRARLILEYLTKIKLLAGAVPAVVPSAAVKPDRPGRGIYSTGGEVEGPGGPTSDDVPAWLSAGEHVLTAAEVVAAGGHQIVENLRDALRTRRIGADDLMTFLRTVRVFAKGGPVTDVVPGYAIGGPVRTPRRFDPTQLYAGLDGALRGVTIPSQMPRSVEAGTVTNNTTDAGIRVEQLTINNPVREPSDRSLRRTLQTLAYLGER